MSVEPIIPASFEIMTWSLGIVWIVSFLAAIVILTREKQLEPGARFLWLLAILVLPVAGPIAWLSYIGYRASKKKHQQQSPVDLQG